MNKNNQANQANSLENNTGFPSLSDNERLLEGKQVMFLLSCSKTYLDKLVKRGILKPTLHGNRYKFFYKDVVAYIERLKGSRDRNVSSSGVTFLNLLLK